MNMSSPLQLPLYMINWPHYAMRYSMRAWVASPWSSEPLILMDICHVRTVEWRYSEARPQRYLIKQEHSSLCMCQGAGTAKTTTGREEVNTTIKDTTPQKQSQLVANIKKLQWAFISVCVWEHQVLYDNGLLTQTVYEQIRTWFANKLPYLPPSGTIVCCLLSS